MLIERPPKIFRIFFPGAMFRGKRREKTVYLTFDDGPVPEVTPWVLDELDRHGIKATFFMVGDNARRNPDLLAEVCRRGHRIGNHTMHHLQGVRVDDDRYFADIDEAASFLKTRLFRPPHGVLRRQQLRELVRRGFRVVMYDLVTRDYSSRMAPSDVVRNVKRYTRPGSVIVFHDSLKSLPRIRECLPESLRWLKDQGYTFSLIDDNDYEPE